MRKSRRSFAIIGGATGLAALVGGCGSGSGNLADLNTPVFRGREFIVLGVPAVDPVTSEPLEFTHVNPAAPDGGDGTAFRPFKTVAAAAAVTKPGGIIYVRSDAAGRLPGFVVPAGVKVLSAGIAQSVDVRGRGAVALPFSANGVRPVVTGTVTLSRDTRLSGFDITPSTGAGIVGVNVTGNVEIADNIVRRAGAGNSAIFVSNTSGDATLRIANNSVSGGNDSGIQVKSDGTAVINATVTGNTSTNNLGSGIFFYLFRGRVTATISGNNTRENRAREPQEAGIRFGVFNDAVGNLTLTNNTSTNNVANGFFVGTQGTSRTQVAVSGNTSTGNTGNGLFVGANENAAATGTIESNTVSNNRINTAFSPFPTGNGIFVGAQVNASADITVRNNTTAGNGDIGIFCFTANNGKETVNVLNNTSTGNTRNGIEINAGLNGGPGVPAAPGDRPEATAVVSGNIITGNLGIGPPLGGGGLFVLGFNRAVLRVTAQNNRIEGNATSAGAFGGMAVVSVQNAQVLATVRSNTFTGNRGANPGFTALAGVPPTVLGGTLAGPSSIALRLTGNASDNGYALVRSPGTTLAAETTGNTGGPVVVPALPVEPLGSIVLPD
ncbi:MAG: right-handed parallel beta-helix repeat-containing protein [Capsulimonadales bacterium]|nr:right-handed parallel beta-helix repeat-containing protein [Capsulimonadales bacterium]